MKKNTGVRAFLSSHRWVLAGVVLGAMGGYAYYFYVGCSSGSCPITSRPFNSSLWGGLMGALIFSMFEH